MSHSIIIIPNKPTCVSYFPEYYDIYECNNPLLQRAVLTATSSMPKRGPKNAVLYGKSFKVLKIFDFFPTRNINGMILLRQYYFVI